jgi:hypothetical protein
MSLFSIGYKGQLNNHIPEERKAEARQVAAMMRAGERSYIRHRYAHMCGDWKKR